jgi:endonuclease/exonuclease/phosphatase family metal-dependent hydrolase
LFSSLALLVLTAPAQAGPAANQRQDRAVTVMTRNVYFGADLSPALAATSLPQLIAAVTSIWAAVQASDIPGRAERLADEIAAARPDLVGLQEVVLWRSQFPPVFGPPDATTVEYDFLDLLLDALAARGEQYSVAISKVSNDVEAPALLPGGVCCREIRFTDREVILARTGRHHNDSLVLSNAQSGTFVAQIVAPLPGGGLFMGQRSWVAVDVAARGAHFRFLSTHLDIEGPITGLIQQAQGQEVLLGPASTTLPVVYVCDCNSRADGTGTSVFADTLAAGFRDAWSERHPGDPGYTCCQDADLGNPQSLLDQRLDIVFVRGDAHIRHASITGDEEADRTADGLWPSDHAGVAATLQFRR